MRTASGTPWIRFLPMLAAVTCLAGTAGGTAAEEFHVRQLEADVRFDLEHGVLEETVRLVVEGSGAQELAFRIHEGLLVERSWVNEGVVEHRKLGSRLRVVLHPPLEGTRELTLRISGTFNTQARSSRITPAGVVLDPADHWYPWRAETWAPATVRVRLPEGWGVVGPGRAQRVKGGYTFRSDRPLRELALAARPGWQVTDSRVVRTPLFVATPSGGPTAKSLVTRLADPFAWLSGALAPYPFESLQLAFDPWLERAVTASGVILWPGQAPAGRAEAADLLADQWFGQLVAGDGRWIEAFAAWQAATYCRDRGVELSPRLAELRRRYLQGEVERDVPLRRAGAATDPAVVRGKGSAAPEMVRLGLDSRAFFAALREWFARTTAGHTPPWSFEEVVALFAARAGPAARELFAQWFERTGAPEITVELRAFPAAEGGWRADLTLLQSSPPYRLPLEVVLHGPGAVRRETIEIEEPVTRVFYVVPFRPARVEADPQQKLFLRSLIARLRGSQ